MSRRLGMGYPYETKLLSVTISTILFLLFGEFFALGWYFLSSWYTLGHAEFFYLSNKPQLSIGEVASEELISDFRLHPYPKHLAVERN